MKTHLLTRMFGGRPAAVVFSAGLGLVLLVGALDYLSGAELSLSILYLFPIALVVWYGPWWAGFSLCVVSTATWLIADAATGSAYSHWLLLVENGVVRFGSFVIMASLLATLRTHLRREQLLARTDGLTNVLNGRAFGEICETLFQLAARYRHPLAIAYIDIDDFKTVNDSEGHSAGDALLQAVAAILAGSVRSSDIVGRLGGDEFAVMMPETGRHGAEAAFGKISRALRQEAEERGWAGGIQHRGGAVPRGSGIGGRGAEGRRRLDVPGQATGQERRALRGPPAVTSSGAEERQPYPQPGSSETRVMRALSGR